MLGRTFPTYSLREGGFLSVIYKDFLHLCDCLVLHYFLEACSTYSSIIERKREQRLIIKVGLFNVCFLSVLKLIKLVNIVRFSKEKRPKSDGCICEGGNLKFLIGHCIYQSYRRLNIYRYQIHLLLLVYKLYSFLFLFWIQ